MEKPRSLRFCGTPDLCLSYRADGIRCGPGADSGKEGFFKMKVKHSKIAIVGAGAVGSSTAFCLLNHSLCDEIVLIDQKHERAVGEALDLAQSVEYLGRNTQVSAGRYADCGDADIVVITASLPVDAGNSRLNMLDSSAKIVQSIVPPIMESGFDGIFIVITNPVDIMSYYVWQLSGMPKGQVIGTGTVLDSARLKWLIGDLLHVDPRSVHGFTMGEHGDSQMVPWSAIIAGGKPFLDILRDNPERLGEVELQDLVHKTVCAGWEIANRKGTTNYAIAASTTAIIQAILHNENRILPVSILLNGEYGEQDVFASVPAVINRQGIKEVVQLHLQDSEQERFHRSIEVIREYTQKLPPAERPR